MPVFALLLFACASMPGETPANWRAALQKELPLLGHRNWIVVVDSAYPLQVSPGVETIETGTGQNEVVQTVLHDLSLSRHVAPVVFMDAELPFLTEQNAPGVTKYRGQIQATLGSLPVQSLPHEQLIKLLGETGNTFHVLILKTTLTVPYTSVFLRLDCKYWSETSEQTLRKTIQEQSLHTKGTNPN